MNPKDQNHANGKDVQAHHLAELNQLKNLLRQSLPPVQSNQLEPGTDLWPQLRARIDSQQSDDSVTNTKRAPATIRIRIHWFDWALAALATAALVFFPGIIPALLYHF